jgi:predicted RNase H-like HicB family nuclease
MQTDPNYTVTWSDEDQLYIGRCPYFPSLAAHGATPEEAYGQILLAVWYCLEDIAERGLV